LSIPYQNSAVGQPRFPYSPYGPESKAQPPFEITNEELIRQFSKHAIPCEKSFVPAKLEIREQTSGALKEDMRRVVILGEDKLHYKVYKLPGSDSREEDGDVSMS